MKTTIRLKLFSEFKEWILGIIILVLFALSLCAAPVPPNLLKAINEVEAGGRKTGKIVGDSGKAIGPFQIHYEYWKDSGVKGKWEDCYNYDYSVKVVTGYLNRYAYDALTKGDNETLARIHNGGPKGYRNPATKPYWEKVRKHLTP
jgi:hypothetical protein